MKFNTLHIVSIIAIFQSILMALFFLLNKKSPRTSNILLSSLLIVFSILVSCSLIVSLGLLKGSQTNNKLVLLLGQTAFLVGPLLFLYIRSLLNMNFSFNKHDWLHLIPFIIAVIYSVGIIQTASKFIIWTYPGRLFITAAILSQNIIYLIALWKDIQSYGLTFKLFLSYIDNSRLSWVRYFTVGYILLWVAQLQVFFGWDILGHPAWCPYGLSLYSVTAFVFFNGILFIALRKPETFYRVQKYQSSILKQSDKEQYREKLTALMGGEKIFLNPSMTLSDIAEKLELAPCYVSQIINESFQQNFRDFINKYRIEESKRLLTQPNQHLNILGIALDAGFNSKSAFNNAFKKHTGITPKEFKKNAS
ncbi:MAG: AraC family transcriptional regulator [Bacteroidota bacterium]